MIGGSRRRLIFAVGSLTCSLVLAGAWVVARTVTAAPTDEYQVTIKTVLGTRLTADAVAATATHAIQGMAASGKREVVPTDIESITAVTDSFIQQEVPEAGLMTETGHNRNAEVTWIVRAHGTFVANYGPPSGPPATGSEGILFIHDADGGVYSMLIPSPDPMKRPESAPQ